MVLVASSRKCSCTKIVRNSAYARELGSALQAGNYCGCVISRLPGELLLGGDVSWLTFRHASLRVVVLDRCLDQEVLAQIVHSY